MSGTKGDVYRWETVASYVATYPDGDDDGACDVDVQIGQADGVWFVRTRDDAGGSDDGPDTAYATEDEARAAAEAIAVEMHEGDDGEDAEDYLARQLVERTGDVDPDGEHCLYWTSAVREDEGPRERYATRDQAEDAAERANAALERSNPGQLLCGFEARSLVDGEWIGEEVSS